MTKVIFRKERRKDGEIIALLPELESNYGHCVCYAHLGQHGECAPEWYYNTRPARQKEYAGLHAELTGIYGPLQVIHRLPRNSWRKVALV